MNQSPPLIPRNKPLVPARFRSSRGLPFLIPNRLDGRPILRIFDVAHETLSAFWDLTMQQQPYHMPSDFTGANAGSTSTGCGSAPSGS